MRRVVCFFLGLILFSACSKRLSDFTIISTKAVSTKDLSDIEKSEEKVIGMSRTYYLLGLIPLGGMPNMKDAIDRSIEEGGVRSVALVDGVLYYDWAYFGLFAYNGFTVEGRPLLVKNI